jgi:hypothetical protein
MKLSTYIPSGCGLTSPNGRRINTVKSRGRKLYSEEFHNKYYHDKQIKDESSWLEHVSAIREKRNT